MMKMRDELRREGKVGRYTSQIKSNINASAITHTNGFECVECTTGLTHGVADWLRLCHCM